MPMQLSEVLGSQNLFPLDNCYGDMEGNADGKLQSIEFKGTVTAQQ